MKFARISSHASLILTLIVSVSAAIGPLWSGDEDRRLDESGATTTTTVSICPAPDGAPIRVVSLKSDEDYTMMLRPREEGWLSSDVAYSIVLDDSKTLWLFGDTFIGEVEDGHRVEGADFIHSTLGIEDRTQPPPDNIEFYWSNIDGENHDFFPHQKETKGAFYWTTMGMMLRGELFIYCYPINETSNWDDWIPETTLIRVKNPLDHPAEWDWTATDWGIGDTRSGFHTAVFVDEPYVYYMGRDGKKMVLARATTEDVFSEKLADALEFWADSPDGSKWSDAPENLTTLFEPSNTESGIQYIEEWGIYVATTYSPHTPDIYLTTAHELTGPWSAPVCIYHVPEHDVSFPIISYAVRPHPELASAPGELVISYATNAQGAISPLFTKEGYKIYWPKFIRVQLELN